MPAQNDISAADMSYISLFQPGPKCQCRPVLIVDDNEFNIQILKQMIKKHFRLRCDRAENGKIAVQKFVDSLACCPYRIVFMDINMPVMDGHEASRHILEMMEERRITNEANADDLSCTSIDVREITTKIVALTADTT